MNNKQGRLCFGLLFMLTGFLGGCASMISGNNGQVQSFPSPLIEAGWIRNGEPIEFEGTKWYPVKDYEVLQDSEVFLISEYKGVKVFVEKIAVKPYERIFTKFDKNKFRYFEHRDND
jgi:hypothetical protein